MSQSRHLVVGVSRMLLYINSPDRILICNNKCFSLRGSVALWGKCQYCIRIISRSRLVEFLISNDRDRTAGLLILIVVKRNQFFDSFFRKFRRTYMFLPYKISIESSECYSALKSMSENKSCWFVPRKRLDLTYPLLTLLWSIGHEQLFSNSVLC